VFGRKNARQAHNHRQQFMSEFGEGVGALRRAAGHLAQGTAESLSPTYDRARDIAGRGMESTRRSISPMYRQMRQGPMSMRSMRRLQKEATKRSRMRMLRGLLVTGAAVGAASAAVARRRRQQAEWAEYGPTGTDESRYAESAYGQRSAKQKVAAGAASMADSLSDRAGRIADNLHERSAGMPEKPSGQHHDTGAVGASSVPMGASGPTSTTGGPPASMSGPGPRSQPPMSSPRDRLGDPALDFPDER
jgi:hypothetical protein